MNMINELMDHHFTGKSKRTVTWVILLARVFYFSKKRSLLKFIVFTL
ncbi:MAG: hypothetical protein ABFD25_01470 [Clostridiaceae bacterium]